MLQGITNSHWFSANLILFLHNPSVSLRLTAYGPGRKHSLPPRFG